MKKLKKCPKCKKGNLLEEYEECARCGGGIVYLCNNDDCNCMFNEKFEEL